MCPDISAKPVVARFRLTRMSDGQQKHACAAPHDDGGFIPQPGSNDRDDGWN